MTLAEILDKAIDDNRIIYLYCRRIFVSNTKWIDPPPKRKTGRASGRRRQVSESGPFRADERRAAISVKLSLVKASLRCGRQAGTHPPSRHREARSAVAIQARRTGLPRPCGARNDDQERTGSTATRSNALGAAPREQSVPAMRAQAGTHPPSRHREARSAVAIQARRTGLPHPRGARNDGAKSQPGPNTPFQSRFDSLVDQPRCHRDAATGLIAQDGKPAGISGHAQAAVIRRTEDRPRWSSSPAR